MKTIIVFSSSYSSEEDDEIPHLQGKNDCVSNPDAGHQNPNQSSQSTSESYSDVVMIKPPVSQNTRLPSKKLDQNNNTDSTIISEKKAEENEIKNDDQEDDSGDITLSFTTIDKEKPFTATTFAISRKKKKTIRGTRYFYYFYSNCRPIFCAKAKSRHPTNYVPICEGTSVRMKGESQYVLTINNKDNAYILRRGGSTGEELLSITHFVDTTLMILPKHVDVQTKPALGIPPLSLTTKVPKTGARGMSRLDFHNKFTIPSEKNMIFVQNSVTLSSDFLIVRKISKDGMEIDLCADFPNIAIFAIGLAIFFAKFH